MKHTVDYAEAEKQLAKLLEEVSHGREVLITRDGLPLAKLVPPGSSRKRRMPGMAKDVFTVPDDFDAPVPDFGEYK